MVYGTLRQRNRNCPLADYGEVPAKKSLVFLVLTRKAWTGGKPSPTTTAATSKSRVACFEPGDLCVS